MSLMLSAYLLIAGFAQESAPLTAAQRALPATDVILVGHNGQAAQFLDAGKSRRDGDWVEVGFYEVRDPPVAIGEQHVVQIVGIERINCRDQRHRVLGMVAYDAEGAEVVDVQGGEEEPIADLTAAHMRALIVCGIQAPKISDIMRAERALSRGLQVIRNAR